MYKKTAVMISISLSATLIFSADLSICKIEQPNSKSGMESSIQSCEAGELLLWKKLPTNFTFDLIVEDAGHYYKDQIISLFILFRSLKKNGIFIIEELDFPDTRQDMNPDKKHPTLREILMLIQNKKDFNSELISTEQKEYFLKNLSSIEIFKGNFNEIAFIKKK